MPPTDARQHANAPMTPLEKALAWHKLGKWTSPNAESVKHVEAILAELERVKLALGDAAREIPNVAGPVDHRIRMLRSSLSEAASVRSPDPALVARVRSALEFGAQRKALAVPIDIEDVQQLLELLEERRTA